MFYSCPLTSRNSAVFQSVASPYHCNEAHYFVLNFDPTKHLTLSEAYHMQAGGLIKGISVEWGACQARPGI